jgi:hypothetical protein
MRASTAVRGAMVAGALAFGASSVLAKPGSAPAAAARSCPEYTDTRQECQQCCAEVYGGSYSWFSSTRRCICQLI